MRHRSTADEKKEWRELKRCRFVQLFVETKSGEHLFSVSVCVRAVEVDETASRGELVPGAPSSNRRRW